MGPILFTHNENIAHVMTRVTAQAVTFAWCTHTGKPAALILHGVPGITNGCAIHASQTISIKNNRLTF